MGRPTKLTPEVQAVIIKALETGHYAEVAATLAGVDEKTYYNWLKAGSKTRAVEPYASFFQSVKKASAKAEDDALNRVHDGATGGMTSPGPQWQSAMTFLERRFHARWGQRDALYEARGKQMRADLEKTKAECETLKAKLKLLEAGQDPDANRAELVVHPDAMEE